MQPTLWILILTCAARASAEYLMGGHMDNSEPPRSLLEEIESSPTLARTAHLGGLDLDLDAEESTVAPNDEDGLRYRVPYPFAFNGGRPFSLEKDPITGKIDFEKAPPVKALNYTNRYQENVDVSEEESLEESSEGTSNSAKKNVDKETEDVSPNEINPYSPNFHDFLNLPVHYSSNKYGQDKYPLISSSYANTKVQSGTNSYSTYNHKPYHGETVLYYPTVKPYVPKTTPTTTTTMKPPPTSTVRTTTTTTTPSTTTSVSTKAPIITTWKPPVTSTKRYDHVDDYEDILPIEKLQASMYSSDHQGPNVVQHNRGPQTKPPTRHDEYVDSYEDYEVNDGEDIRDYASVNEQSSDFAQNSTVAVASSAPNETTTVAVVETTAATTASPSSTTHTQSVSQENVFSSNPLQFQVLPQRPVTSMPLDSDPRVPPAYENVVENRRPGIPEGVPIISGYRPNQVISQRPSLGGNGMLVESTSNIVIPPDQDTVSFVLGNRQNVEGGYYSLGTAIGENPYGSTGVDASFRPVYSMGTGADKGNYDPQADRRETVAFPSVAVVEGNSNYAPQMWRQPKPPVQKLANDIEPPRPQNTFVKGLLEEEEDKKTEKDGNFVVFPKSEESTRPVEEHIVVINEADGSIRELTTSSTTMKPRTDPPTASDDGLPQLSENLTPPAERPRPPPPFYYLYHHGGTARPDYPRPQRLPLPPRGKQPPAESLGIRRRPYTPDANLPNILPQFRPNAKTSHGHRGSEAIGTIPAGQSFPARVRQPLPSHPSRRPLPPPPSYLQRLNPPPPPVHTLRLGASSKSENTVPPREPESTVKRFRLPSIPASSRVDEDKPMQPGRLSNQKLRLEEEERSERYSEEPPQMPPRPPLFPKRRTADPPHVATLQMIQQHGEFEEGTEASVQLSLGKNGNEESGKIVTEQEADRRKFDNPETIAEAPVYVVYPVNTAVNIHPDDSREQDESVVVGTRGPHRPLPPETLLQDNGADEIDDEQTAVVHNLFNGRPVASDFPYPLERPDSSVLASGMRETPLLVPSDQRQEENPLSTKERNEEADDKDTSVNVIPYLQDFVPFPARKNEAAISATLHRLPSMPSSTPIAYVYTPTAQASHHLEMDIRDEEMSKVDRNDQKPVLLPSQQPSSSSSSAPSPQNFMAPFVASVSAEAPAKNGWSVVVVDQTAERKSDDDRDNSDASESDDTQTEKNEFDVENFKPQLFGGFKPIYEFPMEDADRPERREASDMSAKMGRSQESGNPAV